MNITGMNKSGQATPQVQLWQQMVPFDILCGFYTRYSRHILCPYPVPAIHFSASYHPRFSPEIPSLEGWFPSTFWNPEIEISPQLLPFNAPFSVQDPYLTSRCAVSYVRGVQRFSAACV